MTEQPSASSAESITTLLERLHDEDPTTREGARLDLVSIGRPAVPHLLALLADGESHARWESAKALVEIADPATAQALVTAMDDDDHDVRWVAAEGAAVLGRDGLRAVLQGLIRHSDSLQFCQSSHHALRRVAATMDAAAIQNVIEALESEQRALAAPPAAQRALEELHLL